MTVVLKRSQPDLSDAFPADDVRQIDPHALSEVLTEVLTDTLTDGQRPTVESATAQPAVQHLSLADLPAGAPSGASALTLPLHPLHAVQAQLQVTVGWLNVTVGELLSAREAHVFPLETDIEDAVDLTLDGKVVARGKLVAMDGKFALCLTELPRPLTL